MVSPPNWDFRLQKTASIPVSESDSFQFTDGNYVALCNLELKTLSAGLDWQKDTWETPWKHTIIIMTCTVTSF